MKNILKIASVLCFFLLMSACATSNKIPSAKVNSLLEGGEFTFMAERANPTNFDVINVMNSLPNSSSARILNLDYGYTLVLKKDEIIATLPYYGRLFTPSFDNEKNSYRFTSKDFTINKSAGKKGSSLYIITLKDQPNIQKMNLEIFGSGKSYLSMSSNDRQPISYDGYIMENTVKKN